MPPEQQLLRCVPELVEVCKHSSLMIQLGFHQAIIQIVVTNPEVSLDICL
jgi:hypothetical protein